MTEDLIGSLWIFESSNYSMWNGKYLILMGSGQFIWLSDPYKSQMVWDKLPDGDWLEMFCRRIA